MGGTILRMGASNGSTISPMVRWIGCEGFIKKLSKELMITSKDNKVTTVFISEIMIDMLIPLFQLSIPDFKSG
jgi:hypothetical protein